MASDPRADMRIILNLAEFSDPTLPQNLESEVPQPNFSKHWLYASPIQVRVTERRLSVLGGDQTFVPAAFRPASPHKCGAIGGS
jgi:hypothetical protein